MMECGDKYSTFKIDATQTSASLTQMNSPDDKSSLDILISKLNIPLNCLDNSHIRQHYLEEYSAKYSKAKYLLSNARKKQRKIIISYYKEKEKQDNIDELQTIKQSLLEENEKIKKFKEALKDKLLIYQQRIQFLKDAEFWSAFEIQQLQNNTNELCQVNTENHPSLPDLPTANDSLDLLHGHEHSKYPDNFLDDSSLNNTDDHDDSKPNYHDSFLIKDHCCIDNILKPRKQSHMKVDNCSTMKIRIKNYFQWFKNFSQLLYIFISNDRFKIISMILMTSLAIFFIIFVNDLLEYFLIYVTKTSGRTSTLSSPESMPKSSFTNLLLNIYNWTTSWLLPFFRIFEYSV